MAIPVNKEQREKAKREGLYMVQISVDRKYTLPKGRGGAWAITGTFTKDMADELQALCQKWAKEGKL